MHIMTVFLKDVNIAESIVKIRIQYILEMSMALDIKEELEYNISDIM